MSDWKSRAQPVQQPSSDWRTRAQPVKQGGGAFDYLQGLGAARTDGVFFGLGDEITAAMDTAIQKLPGTRKKQTYEQNLADQRAREQRFAEENPVASTVANIAGGLANPINTLGAPGKPLWETVDAVRAAGTRMLPSVTNMLAPLGMGQQALRGAAFGAGSGAAYGFGEGEGGLGERLGEAATGAAIGGVVGGAAPGVFSLGAKGADWVVSQTMARLAPNMAQTQAARKAAEALARDGFTPDEAAARIAEMGPDAILADMGKNVRQTAGALLRQPGKGAAELDEFLVARQEGVRDPLTGALQGGQVGRVGSMLDDVTPQRFRGTMDDLSAQRRGAADPLYREAFQGGSTAPLQRQLEDQFADIVNAERAAQKALTQAENALTQSRANVSRAGNNVYMNAQALPDDRAAAAALEEARKAVERVSADKSAILARLRQAQGDAASNAPGAVWSPRVQQFLDDPISKSGLARGVEIQRLEALASNRPFNPSELAITGFDDAGNPIVGSVPNLRTLDAIKRGLDDVLEGYRDKVTGRLTLDERGRAVDQVRRALITELDNLTGGAQGPYAQARASWATPSKYMDATNRGQAFMSRASFSSPDELQSVLSKMTPEELHYFRVGAVQQLRNTMENVNTRTDVTKKLMDIPALEQRVRMAFGNDDTFRTYVNMLQNERAMFETYALRGGSQTAERLAADADLNTDPGAIVEGLGNLVGGQLADPRNYLRVIVQGARSAMVRAGTPEPVRNEIIKLLKGRDMTALTKSYAWKRLSDDAKRSLARALTQGAATQQGGP